MCELSRFELGQFIRAVTGHSNVRYHRSNVNPEEESLCRYCREVVETFIHFATDCPALIYERGLFFGGIEIGIGMEWTVHQVMGFIGSPRVQEILNPNDMGMMEFEQSSESESEDSSSEEDPDVL